MSKKVDNLRGLQKQTYELLKRNGATSYVVEKTGKSRHSVGKAIKKLIDKGLIKRLDRGIYKVVKKSGWVNQVVQTDMVKPYSNDTDKTNSDYLRLHYLQVKLRVNSDIHKTIRNMVVKKKFFKNIRPSGNNGGFFFNVDNNIGLFQIGNDNIHLTFPETFEITGNTIHDLASKMYDVIEEQVGYLSNLLRSTLFKDGRVNFEITKNHIALVKNGVVKEMKLSGIKTLSIYDEKDGKQRFLMDWSHGVPELEAVHTSHGFDDADRAKFFMNTLKDDSYEKMYKNCESFFDKDDLSLSKLLSLSGNSETKINQLSSILKERFEKDLERSSNISKSISDLATITSQAMIGVHYLTEQNKSLMKEMELMSKSISNLGTTMNYLAQREVQKEYDAESSEVPSYIG